MFRNNLLNKSSVEKPNLFYIFLLLLVFLGAEIIINPIGNFPLNDDWAYAEVTKKLVDNCVFELGYVPSMTLFTHCLWGSVFVKLFGFSHTILRFSTLMISFISILFFYLLLIQLCHLKRKQSFYVSTLVFINPLFLSLSNSFMTDVPFVAYILGSIYFYSKFCQNGKIVYYLLTAFFLIWALLIRQLALSFIIGILLVDCFMSKKIQWRSIALFIISFIVLFAFEKWLKVNDTSFGYPYIFYKNRSTIDSISILDMIINFFKRWIHYISFSGFVLIPILGPYLVYYFKNKLFLFQKKQFIISVILLLPVIWSLQKFPLGDYLYNCGVGAETLYDTYILRINNQHGQSNQLFIGIWLMSLIGSFSLLLILIQFLFLALKWDRDQAKKNEVLTLIVISLFFYYSFLAMASPIFDRYLMVFSVLIIPVLLTVYNPIVNNRKLFSVFFIILSTFSILANKDYLAENRNKWLAINDLKTTLFISDHDINGGKEHEANCFGNHTWWYKKWCNFPKSNYLVSHGSVPNYHYFKSYTYQRYVPFKTDTIFVLIKNEE